MSEGISVRHFRIWRVDAYSSRVISRVQKASSWLEACWVTNFSGLDWLQGHEFTGTVVETGSAVKNFEEGYRTGGQLDFNRAKLMRSKRSHSLTFHHLLVSMNSESRARLGRSKLTNRNKFGMLLLQERLLFKVFKRRTLWNSGS